MFDQSSLRRLLADSEGVPKTFSSSHGEAIGAAAPLQSATIGYPLSAPVVPSVGSSPSHDAGLSPTVCSLRDRLLQEARNERQRCLEVAEAAERRRVEFRGLSHASTQTDHVAFADALGSVQDARASAPHDAFTPSDAGVALRAPIRDEDEEQMEAIRALQKLGGLANQIEESHVLELSRQVENERQQLQKVSTELTVEQTKKESVDQQVICLEEELDSKEAALQGAEHALERQTVELQQALLHIQALEGGCGVNESMLMESECAHLRAQLNIKEHQLLQKDRHISRLTTVLRSCGVFLDEASTTCGSGFSTGSSMG